MDKEIQKKQAEIRARANVMRTGSHLTHTERQDVAGEHVKAVLDVFEQDV